MELFAALAPVLTIPLGDGRGHSAVRADRVLPSKWQLPADIRLELQGFLAPRQGGPMEGAARSAGETGPVEEDAGVVDQPGRASPVGLAVYHAPPPSRGVLPVIAVSDVLAAALTRATSAPSVKCAPYEQQPCSSSGAGPVSTPWQPRP